MKLRNILYSLGAISLFVILSWFFAVPDDLLKKRIEDSISTAENSAVNASIDGFRKGILFSFNADSLNLKRGDIPICNITDISGRINPFYLIKRQLSFSITGKLGEGDIEGSFRLPEGGNLKITNSDLKAIDYLSQIGLESSGYISSDILLNGGTANITFEIPDMNIQNSGTLTLPFINSFHRMQGALSINEDTTKISSISLEGTKGYARLKGVIDKGVMNLSLELMPSSKEVTPVELKLIEKFMVSPGYYLIPLKGTFQQKYNMNY
ncbi:MAG: type II secretion system protein GspN [Nitrospirae bacterium]|nr:type II secretion system protein GspN [Nitrospirota bacterium]